MCGGRTLGASFLSETPKCVAPPKVSWLQWLVSVRFCAVAKMHTNAQKYSKGLAPANLPAAKMQKKVDSVPARRVRMLHSAQTKSRKGKRRSKTPSGEKKRIHSNVNASR